MTPVNVLEIMRKLSIWTVSSQADGSLPLWRKQIQNDLKVYFMACFSMFSLHPQCCLLILARVAPLRAHQLEQTSHHHYHWGHN